MTDLLTYAAICLGIAIIAHLRIRSFLVAFVVAVVASLIAAPVLTPVVALLAGQPNIGFGADDLVFWGPLMMFGASFIALPVAAIAGVPFAVAREIRSRRG